MPAPSSPQIPQKYWDELSQPPSWKGEDLLIQNIVAAIKICGILVISSSKTLKLFDVCLMMHLSHDALVPWCACPTKQLTASFLLKTPFSSGIFEWGFYTIPFSLLCQPSRWLLLCESTQVQSGTYDYCHLLRMSQSRSWNHQDFLFPHNTVPCTTQCNLIVIKTSLWSSLIGYEIT